MTTYHQRLLARVREDFECNTAAHELTVLSDLSTGESPAPYRHLRIAAPGTRIYSWDIVTWPGHLATAGDIADGYTFARIHDMAHFFTPEPEPYRINPGYWAEKLACSQREHAKEFSLPALLEAADADIDAAAEEYGPLAQWKPEWIDLLKKAAREKINEAVEFGHASQADAAYAALHDFEYTTDSLLLDLSDEATQLPQIDDFMTVKQLSPFSFDRNGDAYEIMSGADEYDYHLLLAMHAVVRGLELYRQHLAAR